MRIKKETHYQLGILGKVKVGELAPNKSFPISLDYFRFTSNDAARVERMRQMFGDKPSKLPITFHSNDTNIVCVQKYELRDTAGKLVAYGDGQTFFESHKDGFLQKPTLTSSDGEAYMATLRNTVAKNASKPDQIKWHETLTIRFVVMGYPELGLWEFTTKGKDTSIGQIIASFDTVLAQAGRVMGMPFWLTVEKHKSNRANANRQYPVVNLVCDLSPEMVERVYLLGSNLDGFLVTPQKLSALPMPEQKAAAVQVENDIEDAEIIMDGGDDFLDEINATNATHDPGTDHEIAYIVGPPPRIPTDDELEQAYTEQFPNTTATTQEQPLVEEMKERFSLEQQKRGEILDSTDERFKKLCNWVISSGASMGKVSEFLFGKSLAINADQEEHLKQLRGIRRAMLSKDMDLQTAKGQNGVEAWEWSALETLAKENNLK